ncbi:MAG: dockerin type I repeat-containing protein [Muribaculaceae bacterium]|nr:dockerin type I repeat-containing protein [Muribaculaceae bacterium]
MKKAFTLIIASIMTFAVMGENKPYITKVYDFLPAPGQFVNSVPLYEYQSNPEPRDSVIARVEQAICGSTVITIEDMELPDGTLVSVNDTTINVTNGMISLGSFGGYVVFGFDHPVVNVKGEYDLQIFGNGFQADNTSTSGGSSEPGIVMVSRDVNGNGIPDDPWYELAGSDYNNPRTQKNFTITYYKPDDSQFGQLRPNKYHDEYIRWTCNSVDSLQEGYVRKNYFHSQSYWPQWVEGETLTFTGTKLPCNLIYESEPKLWVQCFYDWGYVDNRPDEHYGYGANAVNTAPENLNKGFKLDWAVDDQGNHVDLHKIDFVKVYCGILQDCGMMGESSTEVQGAIDLHPDAVAILKGDVNDDDQVNVADVTTLISYILGSPVSKFAIANAYLDDDEIINVNDVTALINYILK